MNAHVIAFEINQIIRNSSLLELRDCMRVALRFSDLGWQEIIEAELARRAVA